jgi:hypothetical protein
MSSFPYKYVLAQSRIALETPARVWCLENVHLRSKGRFVATIMNAERLFIPSHSRKNWLISSLKRKEEKLATKF